MDFELRKAQKDIQKAARKFAKSTLTAAVGLYTLCCEGERGPQVVVAATTGEQAQKVFKPARMMVERTPMLREAFRLEAWTRSIVCMANGGSIQPINAKGSTQDGWTPHMGILDELHAHKDRKLYDVIKSSFGARKNPLLWLITTAGLAITADVDIPKGGANGVILAQGGRFGGWSLYCKAGKPIYAYNFLGLQRFTVAAAQPVPAGKPTIRFEFGYDGGGLGKGSRGRWLAWSIAVVSVAIAAAAILRGIGPATPPQGWPDVRFSVPLPKYSSMFFSASYNLALSPDGRYLAYAMQMPGEPSRLWLRPLDALESQSIPNTTGASEPFWSPDGRSIAFMAEGALQRIARDLEALVLEHARHPRPDKAVQDEYARDDHEREPGRATRGLQSSSVPPKPTTTSQVVHCAPARNSSPSISIVT